MGWGDALAGAWSQASNMAKSAATAVADSAKSAYDYCERQAEQGYDYVRDRAVQAYHAGETAVGNAVVGAERAAIELRYMQGLGPKAAAERAYDLVRKGLGQGKAGSPVQACPLASAQCQTLKDARDKAIMSDNTYFEDGDSDKRLDSTGYSRLNPIDDAKELQDKLGLKKEDLEPDGSDFRARIYKKALPDGATQYIVGYRGTQTGADWKENFKQGTGQEKSLVEDPQSQSSYSRAMRLAKIASERAEKNGDEVSYTGHSLGGGMASAASAVTGNPATTFNAAGLNAHTVGGAYPDPPVSVNAYYTPTDPLSAVQDNRTTLLDGAVKAVNAVPYVGPFLATGMGAWLIKNEALGTPVMPQAYGSRHILPFPPGEKPPDLNVAGLKEAHGMGLVIKGIDAQRNDLGCPK